MPNKQARGGERTPVRETATPSDSQRAEDMPRGSRRPVPARATWPRRETQEGAHVTTMPSYSPSLAKMSRATYTPLALACDRECVTPLPSPMM